ncbi:MAG: hypothetical protein ACPG45_07745 [Flavobacteriaceae bacterium]
MKRVYISDVFKLRKSNLKIAHWMRDQNLKLTSAIYHIKAIIGIVQFRLFTTYKYTSSALRANFPIQ